VTGPTKESDVELFEHKMKQRLGREAAAAELRRLADEIARENSLRVERDGKHYTVDIPDEVQLKVEIEVGDKKSEIEIELKW